MKLIHDWAMRGVRSDHSGEIVHCVPHMLSLEYM